MGGVCIMKCAPELSLRGFSRTGYFFPARYWPGGWPIAWFPLFPGSREKVGSWISKIILFFLLKINQKSIENHENPIKNIENPIKIQ